MLFCMLVLAIRTMSKALCGLPTPQVDTIASMSALPEDVRSAADASSTAAAQQQQQQQMQHSLFVARAAWSTLRKALVGLQEAVSTSLDVATNPAVAYMQVGRGRRDR